MANWKYKIELNAVTADMSEKHDLTRHEEDCPEEVKEAIATELEKVQPLEPFASRVRNTKSIAALNRLLSQIYDAADENSVWCGPH